MKKSKEELEFEIQVLQKRVKDLEKQAEESELKAVAFSTMVDIAEKTFNIPVRKKFSTKLSKK
jgi:16S rRNA G527 N7-methylase RsmG